MEECLECSICSWRMEADIYMLYVDGGVPGMQYMYLKDGGCYINILYLGGGVPGMEFM